MADYAGRKIDSGYAGRAVQAELTAPSGEAVPINDHREASLVNRIGAGVKMTPQGRLSFYQERFGPENVINTDNGIYIIDPKTRRAYPADSNEFNVSDVADFSGEMLQIAPTLAAGSNPLTVGAASGIGNVARQAVSAALPGDDQMSIADRAASLGVDTALGAGTQLGVNKVLGGINAVAPKNIAARFLQSAERRPFAQAGRDVEAQTGVQFTPGQRTGSRTMLTVEGMLRRNPATADIVYDADMRALDRSLGFLNKTLDAFSDRSGDAGSLGDSVISAVSKASDDALSMRSRAARRDFGRVAELGGDKAIMPMDDTLAAVDDLIAEFDVPGGGDASATLVNRLKTVRGQVAGESITANQFQRLLEIWGRAAAGRASVLQDVDRAQQRYIAGRVFGSLQRDLDAAANAAANDNTGSALKAARDRYRANSEIVTEISNSAIGRLLGGRVGDTPETVAARVLKMPESQLGAVFKITEQADPGLAGQIKRAWIEGALEKGGVLGADVPAVASPGGADQVWSPKRTATALRESPIWGALKPEERQSMNYVMQMLDRLADRAGTDGSPTAPLTQAWDMVKSGVSGAAWPFLTAMGARKLARALTDKEGQRALAQITQVGEGKKVGARTLAYFGGLLATDEATDQLSSQPPQIEEQRLPRP